MANNGFFEVVGDDANENVEVVNKGTVDQMALDMFRTKAQEDGYSESDIEEAINRVDAECKCYEDFERIIGWVIEDNIAHKNDERKKQERIKASISLELDNLKSIKEPARHLEKVVYQVYNTTAVNGMELICESEGNENLKLDIYEEPVYSLIMQIKKPWVADLVNKCLAKWQDNPVVDGYIMQYLDYLGTPTEQVEQSKADLIKFLPDSIQQEASPDAYKQFTAVQLIMKDQHRGKSDATEEVFADEDDLVEFAANFENYAEGEVPFNAAASAATEDCYKKSTSWAGKVGSFVGKTVNLKYSLAHDFEDAMRQGMGDYADVYLQNRERIKAQKAELRAKKAEIKHEQKMAELEAEKVMSQERMQAEQEQRAERQQQRQYERQQQQQHLYSHRGYVQSRRDFSPKLPLPVMVGFGSLVVWLFIALFFGSVARIVCGVGLVVFTFGFIRKHIGEPKAMNLIIGGICITVLGLLFGMK